MTEKTTYSKTWFEHDFSGIRALVFLKISEFLDTIDKLYISRFFAIRRCKPRKTAKIITKMHFETHPNPTNSTLEKGTNFGFDFGMILASKTIPKWPHNLPKWHPWPPKGPLGAPWGSHGAHQMPQDRLLAPIWYPNGPKMTPKWPKMISKWPPNLPKWHPLGSQGTTWASHGSHKKPPDRF